MCGSMVDIQYATAENRRGKKKEGKKKVTITANNNGLPITMGGRDNSYHYNIKVCNKQLIMRITHLTYLLHLFSTF